MWITYGHTRRFNINTALGVNVLAKTVIRYVLWLRSEMSSTHIHTDYGQHFSNRINRSVVYSLHGHRQNVKDKMLSYRRETALHGAL